MDVNPLGWASVEVATLLGYVCYNVFSIRGFFVAVVVLGALLASGMVALQRHLRFILNQLLDRTLFVQAERLWRAKKMAGTGGPRTAFKPVQGASYGTNGGHVQASQHVVVMTPHVPLLSKGEALDDPQSSMPHYLRRKDRRRGRRGRCRRCFCGDSPTRQDMLFCCQARGPATILHCVRTSLQLISLYVAIVAIVL